MFDATKTTTSTKPAFLLHVPKDSTSSASGKVITIVNDGKKLILQNVYCGNSAVIGATINDVSAVFVKSATPTTQTVTFTSADNANETFKYYVSGLEAGIWHVTYSGGSKDVTVDAESHFVHFEAKSGSVTMTYTGSGN